MSKADCDDDADGRGGNSNDDDSTDVDGILRMSVLMRKVVIKLMMVMSKLRVLQVTLLNVMEAPKWK